MAAVTICSDFGAPQNKVSHCFSINLPYIFLIFFLFFFKLFILFFGCAGSSLLPAGFLQMWRAGKGATLQLSCEGFSLQSLLLQCRVFRQWALECGLQQLWLIGLVVRWHVESSWTRNLTRVPCVGRQIFDHWTTRKVLFLVFLYTIFNGPLIFGWCGFVPFDLTNCQKTQRFFTI